MQRRTARRTSTRTILVIAAVLLLGGWLGMNALGKESLPDFTPVGSPLPVPGPSEFPSTSLEQFEGMLVGLEGRVVVVNIWASWCAPCRTEMPLLQRAADAHRDDVTILGVASNDDPVEAQRFRDEFGLVYPNVFDTSGAIRVALEVSAYPTTYVFDARGVLRARVNGGISEQRLAGLIDEALG